MENKKKRIKPKKGTAELIKKVQHKALKKADKIVDLGKKSNEFVTKQKNFLHTKIGIAEFNPAMDLIGNNGRFKVISGENLTMYQKGLVKIVIDGVECIVKGDVLIYAISQALSPNRLDKVEKDKIVVKK
jgi:hypothetical protein